MSDEYPKYLPEHDVVVQSEAEHKALSEGKAQVAVVQSAEGPIRSVSIPSEPAPEPIPEPEPAKPEPKPAKKQRQHTNRKK